MDDVFDFILMLLVIFLFVVVVNHDNTMEYNDEKLAKVFVEYNIPLEKIHENKNLFENYEGLKQAYFKLQYEKSVKTESRPILEK